MDFALRNSDPLPDFVLVVEDADARAFFQHNARHGLCRIDDDRALSTLRQRQALPVGRIPTNVGRSPDKVRTDAQDLFAFAVIVNINHPARNPLRRTEGVDVVPLVLPADARSLTIAERLQKVTIFVVFLAGEALTAAGGLELSELCGYE